VVESTIPNVLTDDCAVSSIRWALATSKTPIRNKNYVVKKARLAKLGSNASQLSKIASFCLTGAIGCSGVSIFDDSC
jgi:hypothetical protein